VLFKRRWYKDGQEIKEGTKYKVVFDQPDICALVILNTTASDVGTYTCKAYNQFGEAFDSSKVTIDSKDFPDYFFGFSTFSFLKAGSEICVISFTNFYISLWARFQKSQKKYWKVISILPLFERFRFLLHNLNTSRDVPKLDGARGKKQVWRPHVRM